MTRHGLDAPDVLTDGRWAPDGLILRWTPADQLPPLQRDAHDIALLIACPTCRVKVSQRCRTRTGNPRMPHPTRLVAKKCGCGNALGRWRKLCDACHLRNKRESTREASRRLRARRRATT
jgi:hypothetical protein